MLPRIQYIIVYSLHTKLPMANWNSMIYELLKCWIKINSSCEEPVYTTECWYDFEKSIRCEVDASGVLTWLKILLIVEIDEQTKIPTPAYYELPWLAPWAWDPTTLTQCNNVEYESDPKQFCDEWVEFLRRYVKENWTPTWEYFDTDLLWQLYTPSGNEILGRCEVCDSEVASWYADDISRAIPFNAIGVTKPDTCCEVIITTTAWNITIPAWRQWIDMDNFKCLVEITWVVGTCDLSNTHIMLQRY